MTYRSYLLPHLRDIQNGPGMSEILPGLYIGNLKDSKDSKQLDIHKITHILAIHDDAKKLFKNKKYLLIAAADSPRQDLVQFFSQSNDFIHAARLRGGHVLIHCLAGVSRSVTVAAAYIISVTSLNHQEALQAIRGARNVANPNLGFQKQLLDFERGSLRKERLRLAEKFRPRSAISPHRRLPATPRTISCSGTNSVVAGRLSVRTATASAPVEDNLTTEDAQHCAKLLEIYRRKVMSGEICSGDCADQGIVCPAGVCRVSERSLSMSFLRRGPGNAASPAKKSSWNVWSVERDDQLRWHSNRDLLQTHPNTTRSILKTSKPAVARQYSLSATSSPVHPVSRLREVEAPMVHDPTKGLLASNRKTQSLTRIEFESGSARPVMTRRHPSVDWSDPRAGGLTHLGGSFRS